MRYMLFAATLLVAAAAAEIRGESSQDLLQTARTENRKTVESIHSMYCRFRISRQSGNQPSVLSQVGEFWASGDRVRVKWNSSESRGEILIAAGRVSSFTVLKGNQRGGSVAAYDGTPVGECDPRYFSLFHLATKPGTRSRPAVFDDVVGHRKLLQARSAGDELQIELQSDDGENGKSQFKFDRRKNYLITEVSTIRTVANRNLSAKSRVTRFSEPAHGVYFPSHAVAEVFENDRLTYSQICEFTEIAVNKLFGEDVFALQFPSGCEVHDLIRGKKFVVDAGGRPIGEERSLTTPPPPKGELGRTETREQPRSWTRWILPLSVFCLAASLVVWGIRRWRLARSEESITENR